MRTLYLDCGMGAAGDMLMAALLEICPSRREFLEEINSAGLPGVRVSAYRAEKCGITGTGIKVLIDGAEEEPEVHAGHSHGRRGHVHGHIRSGRKLSDIRGIISNAALPEKVRGDALNVYSLIAAAESKVHGVPVEKVHFHEVGAMDAAADICGVCLLLFRTAPEKILASPVHVGSGRVRCAHGILPVPAPAAAELLKGIPIYGGAVRGELCTPTGAALLRYFADGFAPMPVMRVEKIGCGMGKKDFPQANCLRAMLGEAEISA